MPSSSPPFWARLMQALGPDQFTLIDIGCSGGIDESWLELGEHLRAIGFDPNIEDVERLNAARPLPGIEYIAGFVGLEPDHPFQQKRREAGLYGGNFWDRLAFARSVDIRKAQAEKLSNKEKTEQNLWKGLRLADPDNPIFVPDFVRQRGITDIDFIKLDIDGLDFDVLHSLEPLLASHNVTGFQMEVNFCGRANEADHTFHNTDRFLRRAGFELVDLSVWRYSLAALPQRYLFSRPAQSTKGRPYQGDALYVRDWGWTAKQPLPPDYPAKKLLKLAALFTLRGLDDHAAEILVQFRDRLAGLIDVTAALDELAAVAMSDSRFDGEPRTYARYMELFEQDDRRFYTGPGEGAPPAPGLVFRSWLDRLTFLLKGLPQ